MTVICKLKLAGQALMTTSGSNWPQMASFVEQQNGSRIPVGRFQVVPLVFSFPPWPSREQGPAWHQPEFLLTLVNDYTCLLSSVHD
jgi:hypothetical protein